MEEVGSVCILDGVEGDEGSYIGRGLEEGGGEGGNNRWRGGIMH